MNHRLQCEVLEDRTAPALVTIHGVTFNSMSTTEDVAALQELSHPLPIAPTLSVAASSLTAPLGVVTEYRPLVSPVPIAGATEAAGTGNVTITTTAPNGYITGDMVIISGVGVAQYDGAFTITVTSTTTFTYTDTNTGLANSAGGVAIEAAEPSTIILGPDGNYWIAETTLNEIARMTPAGVITQYAINTTVPPVANVDPNGSSRPIAICVGPDNNIWFTELSGGKIGVVNVAHADAGAADPIIDYALPTLDNMHGPQYNSQPSGITSFDGYLWFGDRGGPNCIGQMTTAGVVVNEFTIPTTVTPTLDDPQGTADPRFIKVGSDGNLWFTELLGNKIGVLNVAKALAGVKNGTEFKEYAIPTTVPATTVPTLNGTPPAAFSNPDGSSEPRGLVLGPDGNMWFTEYLGDKIGRITPQGVITEFQIPTPGVHPFGITVSLDGNIWFTENTSGMIGVMNTSGTFLGQLTLPTANSGPFNIEKGVGDTLVVVEDAGNKIAEVNLGSQPQTTEATVTLTGQTSPNVTVKLLSFGPPTTSNSAGQFQIAGVPLAPGANNLSVLAINSSGFQNTGTLTVTQIVATPPVVSAQLDIDLNDGTATSITTISGSTPVTTNDGAVSGQIGSNSAVPGVSNGIVAFTAGFDGAPLSSYVNILNTVNLDGSFSIDPSEINIINGGSALTPGAHTLHLVATDVYNNTGTFALPLTAAATSVATPTVALAAASQTAPLGIVSEFPAIATPNSEPATIVLGPDGNYWFAETNGTKIGRMTPAGVITEFQIPTTVHPIPFVDPNGSSRPIAICVGPDGNIWFTELSGGKIGRITPQGVITEFPTDDGPNSQPGGITSLDGYLWFVDRGSPNCIGRLDPNTGAVITFKIPTTVPATPDNLQGTADPRFIKVGSDGNLWFTELLGNNIGMLNITDALAGITVGAITEFPLPSNPALVATSPTLNGTPPAAFSNPLGSEEPRGLVLGPDGNIWFTEYLGDKIGRITPAGVLTEFQIPTPGVHPFGITVGPNNYLYFAENTAGMIGVMNTNGVFLGQLTLPTPNSGPFNIEKGVGNTLVVVEDAGNRIAEVNVGAFQPTTPLPTTGAALEQTTLATATLVGQTTPGATVTLLNTNIPSTTADATTGDYQFTGVPLSLGTNIFSVQASSGGSTSVGSVTITRIAATAPVLSADLASDVTPGLSTGITTDPAVSGQIGSNSAVPGVSSGIVSLTAGLDNTPASRFHDVSATLNVDGSFNLDDAVMNQLAAGGKLAKGTHTLHLTAKDIFGNTTTITLTFTLD